MHRCSPPNQISAGQTDFEGFSDAAVVLQPFHTHVDARTLSHETLSPNEYPNADTAVSIRVPIPFPPHGCQPALSLASSSAED